MKISIVSIVCGHTFVEKLIECIQQYSTSHLSMCIHSGLIGKYNVCLNNSILASKDSLNDSIRFDE
tara:strand:- start:132 stop:329 length:198 start_codon:yes stop_codon:yes gene_type:complete